MQGREIMQLLPCAAKPLVAAIRRGNLCYGAAATRGKTCGSCNLRLQYKCGKLCSCCHKRENLRWQQYTSAGNNATASLRENICGGCNTGAGNYATVAMRGKTCGGCNTGAGSYATAAVRGKTCGGRNTGAGSYATAAMRGKTCGGCITSARKPMAATIQVR